MFTHQTSGLVGVTGSYRLEEDSVPLVSRTDAATDTVRGPGSEDPPERRRLEEDGTGGLENLVQHVVA